MNPPATVGFVGHRDLGRVAAAPAELRRHLAAAARALAGPHRRPMTLVTGVAEGADSLAIALWRAEGLGPVHGIYPDAETLAHAVDRGDHARLDSHEVIPAGQAQPHRAVAERILERAGHLLAIYDGGASRGGGGTADTIRRARERGIGVSLVPPSRSSAPD